MSRMSLCCDESFINSEFMCQLCQQLLTILWNFVLYGGVCFVEWVDPDPATAAPRVSIDPDFGYKNCPKGLTLGVYRLLTPTPLRMFLKDELPQTSQKKTTTKFSEKGLHWSFERIGNKWCLTMLVVLLKFILNQPDLGLRDSIPCLSHVTEWRTQTEGRRRPIGRL